MISIKRNLGRTNESNLEHVIASLASYICATDQPRAVLKSAVAALVSEVEQINRTAHAHAAAFSENLWS
jgi:hypothetical protein